MGSQNSVIIHFMRLFTISHSSENLRLVRLIRLIRMFSELWLIVNSLMKCMMTLFWLSMLMLGTLYAGGIFCTMQIGQNDEIYNKYYLESGGWDHEVYFGT